MVAAQRPKNLIGVILCATFVTSPWPVIRPAVAILARSPLFSLYLPYKRMKAAIFGYSTPEHRVLLAEMQRLVRPYVIASRVRMVFRVDAREALHACDVPMLYMKGGGDMIAPGWNLQKIRRIKPQIQVVTIGSSHMLLQRHAVEAAAAIATFVSSLGMK
jgi:pimeloyl-ACP methyl ester carboxylesterase